MYFVTEMDSDSYLGSVLNYARRKTHYFAQVKKALLKEFGNMDIQFVKMSELYDLLDDVDTQATILLSKYARPYKKAILAQYPAAHVIAYQFEEEEPRQPSPLIRESPR